VTRDAGGALLFLVLDVYALHLQGRLQAAASVEVVAHHGRVSAVVLSIPHVQVRNGVGCNITD
jgi:hypothetical protein